MEGKNNYSSQIVQHSVSNHGNEVITFRLHYPRFIHAEMLRHRAFSRNVSSSRAIPIKSVLEQIKMMPAMPVYWGKNKSGMQAIEEINELIAIDGVSYKSEDAWKRAAEIFSEVAEAFEQAGIHKQIVNRLVETFIFTNEVVTATDFDNFFYLRIDKDAQPEIQHIAELMYEDLQESEPFEIKYGEWHLPYIDRRRDYHGGIEYYVNDKMVTLEDAQKISMSACAQASYRKLDLTLEKAGQIYHKLVTSRPIHASSGENLCTPFSNTEWYLRKGMSKVLGMIADSHSYQLMYKGNFKGFTQYRKLLPNDTCFYYNGIGEVK